MTQTIPPSCKQVFQRPCGRRTRGDRCRNTPLLLHLNASISDLTRKRRQLNEGERSSSAFQLFFIIIIILLVPVLSPRRFFRRDETFEIDQSRSIRATRSLTEHRRFPRRAKVTATGRGTATLSGKKTRVTGAYSYEGRSGKVTGNLGLPSCLSPSRFMLQTSTRLQ